MQKIAIGVCVNGLILTHPAILRYHELKGIPIWPEFAAEWLKKYPDLDMSKPEDGSEIEYYLSPPEVEDRERHSYFWLSSSENLDRRDETLHRVLDELGSDATYDGFDYALVPDDVKWHIATNECGSEWVAENHRVWKPEEDSQDETY